MAQTATLHTNHGDIVIDLFADQAPTTVDNFVGLATGAKEYIDSKSGARTTGHFYDGLTFHRIIDAGKLFGDRIALAVLLIEKRARRVEFGLDHNDFLALAVRPARALIAPPQASAAHEPAEGDAGNKGERHRAEGR